MAKALSGHSPPSSPTSRTWFFVLGAVTAAVAVSLVFLGVWNHRAARQEAAQIAAAQAMHLVAGVRRQLKRPGPGMREERLTHMYGLLAPLGVTAVAAYDRWGRVADQVGTPAVPFAVAVSRDRPPVRFVKDDLAQVVLGPPPGPGRRPWGPPRGGALALEFRAGDAVAVMRRAWWLLWANVLAACVLVGGALVSAVRFVHYANLEHRLQEDAHLKSLGRMSAIIGHELKNTVASIKGHAQLLAEERDDPSAAAIAAESVYLQRLIAQLLEFVKTGKVHRTKVYLDDLLEGAVAVGGYDNVEVRCPQGVWWMLDRDKMLQVVRNLVDNAVRACPQGPVVVWAEPGDVLRLGVDDAGPGIPPERRDQVFAPFVTTEAQGTGLGLALVRAVVEAHGGAVRIADADGGGARVEVTIPKQLREDA